MSTTSPHWPQPSHPNIIAVEKGTGAFSTRAVALQCYPPKALVTKITSAKPTTRRTYATVQASKTSDIELNSDLVYCNHSCRPTVVFDMERMEVRVVDDRPLHKGEDMTFFYPSTEWDMQQPFECNCGAGKGVCVGTVKGARYLDEKTLDRYWLNGHIKDLLAERARVNRGCI